MLRVACTLFPDLSFPKSLATQYHPPRNRFNPQQLFPLTLDYRAQYANLAAVLGRPGPHGLNTVYLDDLRFFYEKEDLPAAYGRRELPYFSVEANDLTDRMTQHIGYQIERPFPKGDGFGQYSDVEPLKAAFEGMGNQGVQSSEQAIVQPPAGTER